MALLGHSGSYFLTRILVGGASFAIIAVYTRLLHAQEFGELALALAGIIFFVALFAENASAVRCRDDGGVAMAIPSDRRPLLCHTGRRFGLSSRRFLVLQLPGCKPLDMMGGFWDDTAAVETLG
jgi:hypothetical protein